MKLYKSLFTVRLTVLLFFGSIATSLTAATEPVDTLTGSTPAPLTQFISIGYLSYDTALTAMPDYAIAQKHLQELREAYEAELKRVEDEFNEKYEAFLEGQRDFPRTILLKRQTELQQLMQQNMEFKHQGLKELEEANEQAMAPLREKLNAAVAKVAKTKGLAVVVNTDSNACPFIDPDMSTDIQKAVATILAP